MQILTNLWAIQKFMRNQKVFQFYSSSILIVYDARKLKQVLELQKRQQSSSDGSNLNNNNNLLSPVLSPTLSDSSMEFDFNTTRNGKSSTRVDSPVDKVPPKTIYKKIQRSHSSMNNYEQVGGS
jgi:1D-myo-inositol-tetrakisphosphate 5-kinase/inositol-polyphosphate multikinase